MCRLHLRDGRREAPGRKQHIASPTSRHARLSISLLLPSKMQILPRFCHPSSTPLRRLVSTRLGRPAFYPPKCRPLRPWRLCVTRFWPFSAALRAGTGACLGPTPSALIATPSVCRSPQSPTLRISRGDLPSPASHLLDDAIF
jgi:hypothetical protein